MKVVIQRVGHAQVTIDGTVTGKIDKGYLVLLGIGLNDNQDDIDWLCKKISSLRIFNDKEDKMNLSLTDVNGRVLVISQFTLHASIKKGNRPSYTKAAPPTIAIPLYERFIKELGQLLDDTIETGKFGADMKIELLNDGPVTIIIDSKNKQ